MMKVDVNRRQFQAFFASTKQGSCEKIIAGKANYETSFFVLISGGGDGGMFHFEREAACRIQ